MPTNDQSRQELFAILDDALGARGATLLMAAIPPFEWSELATKRDLDSLRVELRGEMAELRGELRGEMAELRGDMRGLRGEMTGLQGELCGEIKELGGELVDRIAANTRTVVYANLGAMMGLGALVLAATRLS
jgi:hypothetical protein